jgi:phosphoribosyl 1,2-cyclic phosphodiesterase
MTTGRRPGPAAESAAAVEPPAGPGTLRLRCWGTRGSVPTPGPDTVRYGGNTPCVEVVDSAGERLIFDAGSGIRVLGDLLGRQPEAVRANLFLTHFHWDHIQGLPFFSPLYSEATSLHIHGAPQDGLDIRTLIAGQMSSVYFPIPFSALTAQLAFSDIEGQPYERGGTRVTSHAARHADATFGFRVDDAAGSLAYLPDNELVGGTYAAGPDWYRSLLRFLDSVDVLVHDAMFTAAEYPSREGWGHSSVAQAVRLAEEAGACRLLLFHHSPDRSDTDLDRLVEDVRNELARRNSPLQVEAAAEQRELVIATPAPA